MNLNDLKPAWKQLVLFNSLQSVDPNQILLIIEAGDARAGRKLPGLMAGTLMFMILIICCQGG